MCAMRESARATLVTLDHLKAASRTVRPSIRPEDAAAAAKFAAARQS